MTDTVDQNIIAHFMKFKTIYLFIVYIIVSWTIVGSDIATLKTDSAKHEIKIDANNLVAQDIQTRLVGIETTLEFIKERVE